MWGARTLSPSPTNAIFHSCRGRNFMDAHFFICSLPCVVGTPGLLPTRSKSCPTAAWVQLQNIGIEWEALIAIALRMPKCESGCRVGQHNGHSRGDYLLHVARGGWRCQEEEEEVPKVVNVKVELLQGEKLSKQKKQISHKLSALNLAPWGPKES